MCFCCTALLLQFNVRYKTDFGQEVFLVGNVPELGNWEVTKGVRLTWTDGHLWQGAINIATG
jgi:alpha-amylase